MENREELEAAWRRPARRRSGRDVLDQTFAAAISDDPASKLATEKLKAERALLGWQRKLKLAETKVKKYSRQVARIEKKISASANT